MNTILGCTVAVMLLAGCGGGSDPLAEQDPPAPPPSASATDSSTASPRTQDSPTSPSPAAADEWSDARQVIATEGLGQDFPFDPVLSADGSRVAFSASDNFIDEIYVRAVDGGPFAVASTTSSGEPADYAADLDGEAPSPHEVGSFEPDLSADGQRVAFAASAVNLVPGDTNRMAEGGTAADFPAETGFDIFVKDLRTGTVVRASTTTDGQQAAGESRAPSLSGDGRTVAFVSSAGNLVPGDTNGNADVFVKTSTLERSRAWRPKTNCAP